MYTNTVVAAMGWVEIFCPVEVAYSCVYLNKIVCMILENL